MVGPYVATESSTYAEANLGLRVGDERTLDIPPVRARAAEVRALLDALLLEGVTVIDRIGAANLAALGRYRWPKNVTELADVAERLAAPIVENGNMSAAAKRLGKHHSTSQEWADCRPVFLVIGRRRQSPVTRSRGFPQAALVALGVRPGPLHPPPRRRRRQRPTDARNTPALRNLDIAERRAVQRARRILARFEPVRRAACLRAIALLCATDEP